MLKALLSIFCICVFLQASWTSADSEKSVPGLDTDRNGIRDDIDEYIKKQNYTADQLNAVNQLCRSLQLAVSLNSENRNQAKVISKEVLKAIQCVFPRFTSSPNPHAVLKQYEELTANTKGRRDSYRRYNRLLDGTTSALSKDDTCEKK